MYLSVEKNKTYIHKIMQYDISYICRVSFVGQKHRVLNNYYYDIKKNSYYLVVLGTKHTLYRALLGQISPMRIYSCPCTCLCNACARTCSPAWRCSTFPQNPGSSQANRGFDRRDSRWAKEKHSICPTLPNDHPKFKRLVSFDNN